MLNSSINKSFRTIELQRKSTDQCETKSFHGCDKYTNNSRKAIAFYRFFFAHADCLYLTIGIWWSMP